MDVTTTIDLPCIRIATLADLPGIPLPAGAEIHPFIELGGPQPTDCKLSFNLLVQLGPLLASMGCMLKILNVLGKLMEFVQAVPGVVTNPPKLATTIGELVPAITEALKCFPPLAIADFLEMIKQILLLILSYLACLLEQIDGILKFKATLDFGAAEGNPALTRTLHCASANADAAMGNALKSLGPLQPILNVVGSVAGMAGQSLTLPDFNAISASAGGGSSIETAVSSLESAVDSLRAIVASLP